MQLYLFKTDGLIVLFSRHVRCATEAIACATEWLIAEPVAASGDKRRKTENLVVIVQNCTRC